MSFSMGLLLVLAIGLPLWIIVGLLLVLVTLKAPEEEAKRQLAETWRVYRPIDERVNWN